MEWLTTQRTFIKVTVSDVWASIMRYRSINWAIALQRMAREVSRAHSVEDLVNCRIGFLEPRAGGLWDFLGDY